MQGLLRTETVQGMRTQPCVLRKESKGGFFGLGVEDG